MPVESYSHIVSEIVTYITRQFGDEAQIQIDEADIIRWINSGQREIISNNTSINQAVAVTDIIANKSNYPLGKDTAFAGIQNINAVLFKGTPLQASTFQEALTYNTKPDANNNSGIPHLWYEKVGLLNLWPVPTEAVPSGLQIYFNKAPVTITATGDPVGVPDNFYNALIQYVLQQAYELDENFQAAAAKAAQFEKSVNIQQNQTIIQSTFFPTIQGDPEDFA